MASIRQSRPPKHGQQHSYSLDPPPGPGCEVTWSIKGQSVTVGSEVGGIRVVGIGASGTMTVEVTGNTDGTTVSAVINCPNKQPESAGPVFVGGVSEQPKEWDWLDLFGKILGGMFGSTVASIVFNWWTGAGIVVCALTGAGGGALGGIAGYLFVHFFDAPRIRWTLRSSFLFTLFFTLAFAMILGLLSMDLEQSWAAQGETWNRVTFGVSAISAFLAATLAGVLNNLRDEV